MKLYRLYGEKQKRLSLILLIAIIALLLAAVGVLAWKYQQAKNDKANSNEATSQRVIEKVSRLYLVPTNERPTVALIQDKSKLDNQDFFKKVNNGDYLLIYQKDKIALVYREKDNKLVNVGPVNLDGQNQDQGQTAGDQTGSKQP